MLHLGFSRWRQKGSAFWDVQPWGQEEIHPGFGVMCCLHLHGQSISQAISKNEVAWEALDSALLGLCFCPEDDGSMFLWNIIEFTLDYVIPHPSIYDSYICTEFIDLDLAERSVCQNMRRSSMWIMPTAEQLTMMSTWHLPLKRGNMHRTFIRDLTLHGHNLSHKVAVVTGQHRHRGHRCVTCRLTNLHSFRITGLLGFLHHLIFQTEYRISEIESDVSNMARLPCLKHLSGCIIIKS
jgi:hypothetical protein